MPEHYRVIWTCDFNADSPQEAAEKAQTVLNKADCNWFFVITNIDQNTTHEVNTLDITSNKE